MTSAVQLPGNHVQSLTEGSLLKASPTSGRQILIPAGSDQLGYPVVKASSRYDESPCRIAATEAARVSAAPWRAGFGARVCPGGRKEEVGSVSRPPVYAGVQQVVTDDCIPVPSGRWQQAGRGPQILSVAYPAAGY